MPNSIQRRVDEAAIRLGDGTCPACGTKLKKQWAEVAEEDGPVILGTAMRMFGQHVFCPREHCRLWEDLFLVGELTAHV